MIFENYFLPLRTSQLTESMFLSRIFGKYSVTSRDSCDPHLEYIGQIKVSDGSLQDCNKALHHYDKMLVEAKFLSRPGKFNETEFVKFWYNCHTIFNSYDLSKSFHIYINDQKFFNVQTVLASIGIFLHNSVKNILWVKLYLFKGLFLGVSNFFNWYFILLIRLRRFRIFFQNQSSVVRSRASNLLIIGGEFYSQKRETGTKRV